VTDPHGAGAAATQPRAGGTKRGEPVQVEVVALQQGDPARELLAGRRLDRPLTGSLVDARDCRISGWVLPASGRTAAVEILAGEHLLRRAELSLPRPDLEAAFPDRPAAVQAGFRATLNLVAVRDEVELTVRALLDGGRRVTVGSVSLRRIANAIGVERPAPLVSVVIPCFNQAHFLAQAIESVLAQSYAEVEIVVVDDGSGDNTREVAARYPGVLCVSQPNRGVAAARNAGLAAGAAELLVFLDADDRLLPEAIEIGVEQLARDDVAAFVAGACRNVDAAAGPLPSATQPLVDRDHYVALLESCFIWSGSSVMYRRRVLEEAGGFDQRLSAGDDYKLYLEIARRHPVRCHDRVVTEYRRHGFNATRDPALILASQVRVLRSERRFASTRREARALRAGIRRTRSEHGGALAAQTRALIHQRRWREAVRRGVVLARWHPGGVYAALRRPRGRPVAAPEGA
jgi:hypothetical protein